jgi:hypothetical protein
MVLGDFAPYGATPATVADDTIQKPALFARFS